MWLSIIRRGGQAWLGFRKGGWRFRRDPTLGEGQWDEKEFLVVRPGHTMIASYEDHIISTEAFTP